MKQTNSLTYFGLGFLLVAGIALLAVISTGVGAQSGETSEIAGETAVTNQKIKNKLYLTNLFCFISLPRGLTNVPTNKY